MWDIHPGHQATTCRGALFLHESECGGCPGCRRAGDPRELGHEGKPDLAQPGSRRAAPSRGHLNRRAGGALAGRGGAGRGRANGSERAAPGAEEAAEPLGEQRGSERRGGREGAEAGAAGHAGLPAGERVKSESGGRRSRAGGGAPWPAARGEVERRGRAWRASATRRPGG